MVKWEDKRSSRGMEEVLDLEDRIERLRHKYEVYFSGIENIDPVEYKMPIRQIIGRLHAMNVRNPAVKFRFQNAIQRFVTLNNYWTRITRQIEEGTFKRDLFRFQVKREADEAPVRMSALRLIEEQAKKREELAGRQLARQAGSDGEGSVRPGAPTSEPATSGPRRVAPTAARRDPFARIHEAYNRERQKLGLAPVTLEKVRDSLETQLPELRRRHNTSKFSFSVVRRGDSVVIKPVPVASGDPEEP